MFLLLFNMTKHVQQLLLSSTFSKLWGHNDSIDYHEMFETLENTVWCIVSKQTPNAPREIPKNNYTIKPSAKTYVRWTRFRAYWKLSDIFLQTRRERGREPTLAEFLGFLQFESTYDWRRPTKKEARKMQKWSNGLIEKRLDNAIYLRARWLADQRCLVGSLN